MNSSPILTIRDRKLLERIADYYRHTFAESPHGIRYLAALGITGNSTFADFRIGFANGSLKNILPDDPEILASLKKLGILDRKGNEVLANCIVLPMHDRDGIVNLYGHNIDTETSTCLNDKGIVNGTSAKHSSSVLLPSVLDALILYDQGFKNVVPVHGSGLNADHFSLLTGRDKEAYIFDNRLAEQLEGKGITTYLITLPDKDIATYFKRRTPEEFEQLLKATNPASLEQSDTLNKRKQTLYRQEEHGFTVAYANRQYQVKGIQRTDTQLKTTIKVSEDVASNKPFELTTIDLYSSRSRHWFSKLCAGLFSEPEALLKEDISRLVPLVEDWQPATGTKVIEISAADKEQGLSFLKNADMFAELLADFETLGVTGEETNKLVGYLAATSRKLTEPLSVLIQSRSAAGKSTLQDSILRLMPPEDFIQYTRLTDQALFYKDENSMTHKILAIEEADGMGGAAYSIRNIQTAKKLTVAVTGKDTGTGKMRTEEYAVMGPVCVMLTTTQDDVDQETSSRFIFLSIDESAAMTEAIHDKQRNAETLEGLIQSKQQKAVIAKHHAAQRLLKPLAVVNPYAAHLRFSTHSLRSRRDHKKYLGLIRAVAYLHQYQREMKTVPVDGEPVEYIEVTLADIEQANRLSGAVLGQCLGELSSPSQTLLALIIEMARGMAANQEMDVQEVCFTRRMVREYTGWSDWQVKTHIRQLQELEYLVARFGSQGKEYRYVLGSGGQDASTKSLNLTSVEELFNLAGT